MANDKEFYLGIGIVINNPKLKVEEEIRTCGDPAHSKEHKYDHTYCIMCGNKIITKTVSKE